jgi:hypothetical protein
MTLLASGNIMYRLGFLASLLTFISYVVASPTRIEKKTFSVTKPHNRDEGLFDGAWALRKAYLRHGIPLPDGLQKRQAPSLTQAAPNPGYTADVPAISESNDLEYLSPTDVGGVMMNLDFDTGSSDL